MNDKKIYVVSYYENENLKMLAFSSRELAEKFTAHLSDSYDVDIVEIVDDRWDELTQHRRAIATLSWEGTEEDHLFHYDFYYNNADSNSGSDSDVFYSGHNGYHYVKCEINALPDETAEALKTRCINELQGTKDKVMSMVAQGYTEDEITDVIWRKEYMKENGIIK